MVSLRAQIRAQLYRYAPVIAYTLTALGGRRAQNKAARHERMRARTMLFRGAEPRVLAGPFAGMKYVDEFTSGPIAPRWLGVYEPQLHSILSNVLSGSYQRFIDIGAAEGYYAVGIARTRPDMHVISFEADPIARRAQRRMAVLNDARNLRILGLCNHRILQEVVTSRSFLLCDIEGAEIDLIDPHCCPALTCADMVIEIHPLANRSSLEVAEAIARRFYRSHEIRFLHDAPELREQLLKNVRERQGLTDDLADLAYEQRPAANTWLQMTQRSIPS